MLLFVFLFVSSSLLLFLLFLIRLWLLLVVDLRGCCVGLELCLFHSAFPYLVLTLCYHPCFDELLQFAWLSLNCLITLLAFGKGMLALSSCSGVMSRVLDSEDRLGL